MINETQLSEFVVRHWELVAALAALLTLLVGNEIQRKLRGIKDVGPVETTQMLNHKDALLLDVREEKEYRDGHIGEAVHIPLAALAGRIGELDKYKSRPVVAYCRSGQRSARAGAMLRKQGFEVYNLGGGMMAWQNANLPTTRK
ncbi:MAG: rhodanese-like domain-containing protein [Gammaproteobacteria bacterium]